MTPALEGLGNVSVSSVSSFRVGISHVQLMAWLRRTGVACVFTGEGYENLETTQLQRGSFDSKQHKA